MKSLAIATCLFAAACQTGDEKKPPPAADPAPADRPAAIGAAEMAVVDAMTGFITGLRNAIAANRGDCDRMAAALAPVMERGKPVLEKARALEEKLGKDKATRDWIQAAVEKRTGSLSTILEGLAGCEDHAGVQKALAGFIQ